MSVVKQGLSVMSLAIFVSPLEAFELLCLSKGAELLVSESSLWGLRKDELRQQMQ